MKQRNNRRNCSKRTLTLAHFVYATAMASVVLPCNSVRSQENSELRIRGLLARLAVSLPAEIRQRDARGRILLIANPGIPVDSTLDLKRSDDRRTLAALLNRVPAASPVFQETGYTVDGIYTVILNHVSLGSSELASQQKNHLLRAKHVLFRKMPSGELKPTRKYSEYRRFEKRHVIAFDYYSYIEEVRAKSGGSVSPKLKAWVKQTLRDWQERGFKAEVESAISTLDLMGGTNPYLRWHELRSKFQNYQEGIAGSSFPTTKTYPVYSTWGKSEGWTHATIADPSGDFTLDVELKRVNIVRPWMDESVFRNRAWRWSSTAPWSGQTTLSTGIPISEGQEASIMPLLPTGLLLARNANLKGREENLNDKIEILEPQIIGWFCEALPRSPSPDPSLKW